MYAPCLILYVTLTTVADTTVFKKSSKFSCPSLKQSQMMLLSVITMCTPVLSCFSGPGSPNGNTQRDASSQSCMYPADGSSQASLLAGNLYMDLDNGIYLYRVLVCSLARLMFCLRLWILWEVLQPQPIPSWNTWLLVHCLWLLWQRDAACPTCIVRLALYAPWYQSGRACSACTGWNADWE